MRWCTTSNEEQSKCDDFKVELMKIDNTTIPGCVQAENAVECMEKIKKGEADLITLDGGDVYKAGKEFGMVPVVGEDYGYGTLSYYAVAVVKKTNTEIQFDKLEGKKTCHTGAGKTAGWNVPVGTLLSKKYMKSDPSCNPYVAAGKYFKESCVPRVKLPAYDTKGNNPDSLCALCTDECTKDGKYSNYGGAFKCMDEGVGDVAFVKHTTVMENKPGMESGYQYLCKDGTRKEIGQHLACNLAKVPSHAVMTSKGNNNTANYVRLLLNASNLYSNDSGSFALFDSTKYGDKKDLLFKDSTEELKDVSGQSYSEFLGDDYIAVIEGLNECVAAEPDGGKDIKPYFLASVGLAFVALLLSGTAE